LSSQTLHDHAVAALIPGGSLKRVTATTMDHRTDERSDACVIAELRSALAGDHHVDQALAGLAQRFPMAFGALFVVALRRHFGTAPDIREITAFVHGLAAGLEPAEKLPRREAEAIIRGALGEPELAAQIEEGSGIDLRVAELTISRIFEGERLGPDATETVLGDVTRTLTESATRYPEIAEAAREWQQVLTNAHR